MTRQYYYKNNSCPSDNPYEPSCICWHDEGTGPLQNMKEGASAYAWRDKSVDKEQPDMINHPPHYKMHPSGVECIQITEHFNFNVGNAVKYLWRAGLKGDQLEDLKKAKWYIEREIERVKQ